MNLGRLGGLQNGLNTPNKLCKEYIPNTFPLTPWKFKIGGNKFKENYYKIMGGVICRVPLQSYMQVMSKSVYVLYCMVWYCRNFCFGRNLFSFFTFFTGPLVLRTGTVPARPPPLVS